MFASCLEDVIKEKLYIRFTYEKAFILGIIPG